MKFNYVNNILIKVLSSIIIHSDFKTVLKKFEDQGVLRNEIEEYFEYFKKARDQNKISNQEEKNIDFWGKKPFQEFKDFVDKLKETKSKTEEQKLKKMEGVELVAENDDYWVYKITNHEAVKTYGSGTKWCITQESPRWWNKYKFRNDFYFYIAKHKDKDDPLYKVAMTIDRKGKKTYFDAPDRQISEPPTKVNYQFPSKEMEFSSEIERIANEIKEEIESAYESADDPENYKDTYDSVDYFNFDFDQLSDEDEELVIELRSLLGLSKDDKESETLKNELLDCSDYYIDDRYARYFATVDLGDRDDYLSNDIMEDLKNLSVSELEALQAMLDDLDVSIDISSYDKDRDTEIRYNIGSEDDYLCVNLNENKLEKRIKELKLARKIEGLEENEKNLKYVEKVALKSKHIDAVLGAIKKIKNKDVLKQLIKRKHIYIQRSAIERLGVLYGKDADVQELFAKILAGKNEALKHEVLKYANQSLLKKYILNEKTDDYHGMNTAVERVKDINFLKKLCIKKPKSPVADNLIFTLLDRDDAVQFVDFDFSKALYEKAFKDANASILTKILKFIPVTEQDMFKKVMEMELDDSYESRELKRKAIEKIKSQKYLYNIFWREDYPIQKEIVTRMSSAAIYRLIEDISKDETKGRADLFDDLLARSINLKNKDLMLKLFHSFKFDSRNVAGLLTELPANKGMVKVLKSKYEYRILEDVLSYLEWKDEKKYKYYKKYLK